MSQTPPVQIFISYAKEDERWLKEVATHLGGLRNKGLIAPFDDRQITVGEKWDERIKKKLEEADLVILLVTKYFLDSVYIHKVELARAIQRDKDGACWLLPVIVSKCHWKKEAFAAVQAFPRPGPDGVLPVSKWQDPDDPLTDIIEELDSWATKFIERRAAERAAQEQQQVAVRSAATGIDLALYLARARKKWEAVDLTALATPGAVDEDVRPTLAQLFVPQDCRRARPPQTVLKDWLREQGIDPEGDEAQREVLRSKWEQEKRVPALDLLGREDARRLVLLGDPGSGKSSLARYVLLELLRPLAEDEARPWRRALDGHIPFLVELRDLITLDAPGQRCPIPNYLADLGARLGFGFTAEAAEKQLQSGRSLLIVDGLDEIFDPARRRDVVEEIIGLETRYRGARVFVTSRLAGFEAGPLEKAGFTVATLDDLSPEQIRAFADAWFELVFPEDAPAASRAREDLIDAIGRRPQLTALAGNPLMLTVMATVARHKRLGRSRTDIYRQALDLLCYGWDYRRGLKLPADSPLTDLDPTDTLKLLLRIAWRMQEGVGLRANAIQEGDLKAELKAYFDADWRFDPPKAGRAAGEMIKLLAERTWIVTPRGPALFAFVHRTFLEYLCAFELNERFRAQTLSLTQLRDIYVLPHIDDDSWHEVIRLLVGLLPAAAAGDIVQAICPNLTAVAAEGGRLGLAWQWVAEVEPTNLREMTAACETTMDAVYGWLDRSEYPKIKEYFQVNEALNAITPGSWPVPCLRRRGLPEPNNFLYRFVVTDLAGAIWRPEPDSYRTLLEASKADPRERLREAVLWAIAAHWPTEPRSKPLLLARAVEDPKAGPRQAALQALAEHFRDATETKPLLLARAVEDPEGGPRQSALQALAQHFRDAAETKPLLLARAVEDPEGGPRQLALQALAQHFRDAAETKPLLLARAVEDPKAGPRHAALQALVQHFRDAAETKPLLLARAVKDREAGPRQAALQALAEHFRDAAETKPLLLARAVEDPEGGPRQSALQALAEHFRDAAETKPLLLARAVEDPEGGPRQAALQALAEHFRDAAETKPLLLARAVEDPEAGPLQAALQALAEHFRDAAETKPLLLQIAGGGDGELSGYAMLLHAQLDGDRERAILLSRDLDAVWPGIDPSVAIDDKRVTTAASRLSWTEEQVRAAYERLAEQFPLRLVWMPDYRGARA